jgi:hypothetical protein
VSSDQSPRSGTDAQTSVPCAEERHLQAFDLELAALGYVASTRLRERLATLSAAGLTEQAIWMRTVLAAALGADRRHEPLFRRFPDDVPLDTEGLWVRKVLVHFLQGEDQPCLFCRSAGTCHVLRPCRHVVCDRCFDGGNYSACPVCERQVDRTSPFLPAGARSPRGVEDRDGPTEAHRRGDDATAARATR